MIDLFLLGNKWFPRRSCEIDTYDDVFPREFNCLLKSCFLKDNQAGLIFFFELALG